MRQHQCFSGRTHATCKGCSERNLQRCIFIKTFFSSLDILKRRTIMTVINNQMRRTGQHFSFTCVYRESSVGVRRHHRNKKLSPASSLSQHKLHIASNSGRRSTVTGMLIQRMRQRGRLFRQGKWYREGFKPPVFLWIIHKRNAGFLFSIYPLISDRFVLKYYSYSIKYQVKECIKV